MPVFYYDPPDRFIAGSVGQPGDRTFYLQATSVGRVTSVVLEKFQVSLLAERIDELLDEVLRRTDAAEIPETAPAALRDDGPLDLPLTEDFRVGAIALAWDSDGDRVVIEAQEESDAPVEPLSDDIPVDGPGVLRVRISPSAARAYSASTAGSRVRRDLSPISSTIAPRSRIGTPSRSSACSTRWTSPSESCSGTTSSTAAAFVSFSPSSSFFVSWRVSSSAAWPRIVSVRCVATTDSGSTTV